MKWSNGKYTSLPEDQRSFLEYASTGQWWVYDTDKHGRLMEGFPKQNSQPFDTLEEAQAWVERNIPPKTIVPDKIQLLLMGKLEK